MLRTEVLSRTVDGRGRITRAVTALFCVISSILWLGAHTCIETAKAAEETMSQRLLYALAVLTIEQEKAAAQTAGSEFRECALACPLMVVIPAGKFTMGSSDNETGRTAGEGPRHEVAIANAFAISKSEVTFEQWDACLAAAECPL